MADRFTVIEAYDKHHNLPALVVRHETEIKIVWPSYDRFWKAGMAIGAGCCLGVAVVLGGAALVQQFIRVMLP
jgi:hypothetical protein